MPRFVPGAFEPGTAWAKEHEADRWVAATTVWLQIPLVAHDAIFANVKDLELLTRLGQ